MSEFEDRVNSLLNDPAQMEKITALAKSLMGGEAGAAPEQSGGDSSGPDSGMLLRLSRLMKAGDSQNGNRQALLEAMKPYLSEKRRAKMDRAIRMARLAKMAQLAMGEMQQEGQDV